MYYILFPFLYAISLLPLRVLYFIGDGIYGIIYYVAGYRKKVVLHNLAIAFPEKTIDERTRIAKNVYHNFVDTFMEAIKLISANENFVHVHTKGNFSLFDDLYKKGKKCQVHCGHNFNWEFIQLLVPIATPYPFLGIYMPIENKALNKIFYNMREKTGTILISATNMRTEMLPYRNQLYLMGLAADQNPGNPTNAFWLYFFGVPTPFVKGPEKNARANDTAVIFAHFTKWKRGHYELHFELATENPNDLAPGELTRNYILFLEEKMRANPDMWLWTHKRWKYAWKSDYQHLWVDVRPAPHH